MLILLGAIYFVLLMMLGTMTFRKRLPLLDRGHLPVPLDRRSADGARYRLGRRGCVAERTITLFR